MDDRVPDEGGVDLETPTARYGIAGNDQASLDVYPLDVERALGRREIDLG